MLEFQIQFTSGSLGFNASTISMYGGKLSSWYFWLGYLLLFPKSWIHELESALISQSHNNKLFFIAWEVSNQVVGGSWHISCQIVSFETLMTSLSLFSSVSGLDGILPIHSVVILDYCSFLLCRRICILRFCQFRLGFHNMFTLLFHEKARHQRFHFQIHHAILNSAIVHLDYWDLDFWFCCCLLPKVKFEVCNAYSE